MKRSFYILLLTVLSAASLHSQCISIKCPPAALIKAGDATANDPALWNNPALWDAAVGSHDLAEVNVALGIQAKDLCGQHPISIRCELFLDLDGDGVATKVFDSQAPGAAPGTVNVNGSSIPFDQRPVSLSEKYRFALVLSGTPGNTSAALRWNTIAAPGQSVPVELPNGLHRIVWTASTGTSTTTCSYKINVSDIDPPAVNCQALNSVNIMPTGMISLWSSDFIFSAADNITPTSQLVQAVRKAGSGSGFPVDAQGNPVTTLSFDCDEQGSQPVEVWVKDLAGNTSTCLTSVNINDNLGSCSNGDAVAQFCAHTPDGQGLEETSFQIVADSFLSYSSGDCFTLKDSGWVNVGFTLTPTDDSNPLNGVTTYDMILIYKFMQGLISFNAWQAIAADVNNDNTVDSADIVVLDKLIKGQITEFPDNTSWRFFAQGCQPDSLNPLPATCDEFYTHQPGEPLPEHYLFTAIKIGDVNGSAISNSLTDPDNGKPTRGALADVIPPTVNCLNGLSVNIMPTQMINLWATDFLLFASDNETPAAQIDIAVNRSNQSTGNFPVDASGNPITSVTFGCQDLGTQPVQLWARDAAGNTAFCETFVLVQDNMQNCFTPSSILACVRDVCTEQGLPGINIAIQGGGIGLPPFSLFALADNNGCTSFTGAIPITGAYSLFPFVDDADFPATATASDISRLAAHLDGTQPFTLPWQWLAADVNNDLVVDAQDLAEMTAANQGIQTVWSNNTSWRFWPRLYTFPFPNPLSQPAPTSIPVDLFGSNSDYDFYGVRVGNVSLCSPVGTQDLETARIAPPKPNPTSTGASIALQLTQAEAVRLTLTEISGKILFEEKTALAAGTHTMELPASAFPHPGVYAWRVEAGSAVQAGKIVRL